VRRGNTNIREKSEPARSVAEYKLAGFPRIMRNRKRLDAQVPDLERFMRIEFAQLGHPLCLATERSTRPGRHPYWNMKTARARHDPANVIAMFVRNQNGTERRI